MRWTPLLGMLMLGCGSEELPSQYARFIHVPGNNQTDAKYEGARRDWVGDLSVTEGSVDGAFTVNAQIGAQRVAFEVRSRLGTYDGPQAGETKTGTDATDATDTGEGTAPAVAENPNGLNLVSLLDKKKGARISLEEDGLTNRISLAFSDDQGLAYISEVAGSSALTERILGGNFIRAGSDLGTAPAGETVLSLSSVNVTTDEGPVEAYPGFPIEIRVQNTSYQFLLLANWDRTFSAGQRCPIDERLAYEMVRIDPAIGFDEKKAAEGVERREADAIDGGGCVVTAE